METPIRRTASAWLLAAAVMVCGLQASGQVAAAQGALDVIGADAEDAAAMLSAGRVVAARHVLLAARSDATGERRERVLELLAAADERLRHLGEAELQLQKADLSVALGDLRRAEMHATSARRSDAASASQRERASALLTRAALLRAELAPMASAALTQAVRDFEAERYAEAKAGFASVSRSGVRLEPGEASTLRRHQERLITLERERGEPFEPEYVPLGVLRAAGEAAGIAALAQNGAEPAPLPAGDDDGAMDDADDLFEQAARFDAQRVLAEGDAAYDAMRWNTARDRYRTSVTQNAAFLTPEELERARTRLAEARAQLGAGGIDLLEQTITQRQILREQTLAEVANLEQQADAAMERGDHESARRLIAEAKLRWRNANSNGVLGEAEYRAKLGELDASLDTIEQRERSALEREAQETAERVRREQAEAERRARAEREARITESLERLRGLQLEQKYEEALQVVEEILFLDPNNAAANLMKDVLEDIVLYRQYDRLERAQGRSIHIESNAIKAGQIIPQDVIAYPPDWPELSVRRSQVQSFVENEADRAVLARLDTQRIPATFDDNTLEDVLAFIATVTNVNLDVDWDALEQLGIERDTRVSLNLREVPARVVLERVLDKVSLDEFTRASWAVQDGILVVSSDESLRRDTFIVIYDVRDLLFDVPSFGNVPELNLDSALQQGGQGGGGGGSIFDQQDDDIEFGDEDSLEELLQIIQENVDFEGWRDNGGDTGIVQTLQNNLIITNTARNHRDIQTLLNKLREVRQLQITIEARILQVDTDFFERIAFDLDVYFNAEDTIAANETTFDGLFPDDNAIPPVFLPSDAANGNTGDILVPQFDDDGVFEGFEQFPVGAFSAFPDDFSLIPAQQNSDGITENLINGLSNFASTINGLNPALGLSGTFLDDIQVDFLVEATQVDQRNVTLNAPRLTFMNGKAANIFVANQRAYVSDVEPVVGTASVAFDPTVDVLNTGFALTVQGVVSADRRYVTLATQFSVAELVQFRSVTTSGGAGGADNTGDDSVTNDPTDTGIATAVFQTPEVFTTQVQTGLTIPDKGTALLGGQRLSTEIDVETGVPILSKIPIINRFFTNTSTVREERTLLILMKPQILIQSEGEEDAFPGLQDTLNNPFAF